MGPEAKKRKNQKKKLKQKQKKQAAAAAASKVESIEQSNNVDATPSELSEHQSISPTSTEVTSALNVKKDDTVNTDMSASIDSLEKENQPSDGSVATNGNTSAKDHSELMIKDAKLLLEDDDIEVSSPINENKNLSSTVVVADNKNDVIVENEQKLQHFEQDIEQTAMELSNFEQELEGGIKEEEEYKEKQNRFEQNIEQTKRELSNFEHELEEEIKEEEITHDPDQKNLLIPVQGGGNDVKEDPLLVGIESNVEKETVSLPKQQPTEKEPTSLPEQQSAEKEIGGALEQQSAKKEPTSVPEQQSAEKEVVGVFSENDTRGKEDFNLNVEKKEPVEQKIKKDPIDTRSTTKNQVFQEGLTEPQATHTIEEGEFAALGDNAAATSSENRDKKYINDNDKDNHSLFTAASQDDFKWWEKNNTLDSEATSIKRDVSNENEEEIEKNNKHDDLVIEKRQEKDTDEESNLFVDNVQTEVMPWEVEISQNEIVSTTSPAKSQTNGLLNNQTDSEFSHSESKVKKQESPSQNNVSILENAPTIAPSNKMSAANAFSFLNDDDLLDDDLSSTTEDDEKQNDNKISTSIINAKTGNDDNDDDDSYLESDEEETNIGQSQISTMGSNLEQIDTNVTVKHSRFPSASSSITQTFTKINTSKYAPQNSAIDNSSNKSSTSVITPANPFQVRPTIVSSSTVNNRSSYQMPPEIQPQPNDYELVQKLEKEKHKTDAYDFPMDIASVIKPKKQIVAKPINVNSPKPIVVPSQPFNKPNATLPLKSVSPPISASRNNTSINNNVPFNPYSPSLNNSLGRNMPKSAGAANNLPVYPPISEPQQQQQGIVASMSHADRTNLPLDVASSNGMKSPVGSTYMPNPNIQRRKYSNVSNNTSFSFPGPPQLSARKNATSRSASVDSDVAPKVTNMYAPSTNINATSQKQNTRSRGFSNVSAGSTVSSRKNSKYAPQVQEVPQPPLNNFTPQGIVVPNIHSRTTSFGNNGMNVNSTGTSNNAPYSPSLNAPRGFPPTLQTTGLNNIQQPQVMSPTTMNRHARSHSSAYAPNAPGYASKYAPTVQPHEQYQQQHQQPNIYSYPQKPQNVMSYKTGTFPDQPQMDTVIDVPIKNPEFLRSRQFPIFHWGQSSKVVYLKPIDNIYQQTEIHIISAKEISKTPSYFNDFPGPLIRKKTKLKDIERWLNTAIEKISQEDSLLELCLWKILKIKLSDDVKLSDIANILYDSTELSSHLGSSMASNFDISNTNKKFNASKIEPKEQIQILKYLQVGNQQGALNIALANGDYAMALIIGSLIGKDAWSEVVDNYLKELFLSGSNRNSNEASFSVNLLGLIFQVFVGNSKRVIDEFYNASEKSHWALDNWNIILSSVLTNSPKVADNIEKKLSPLLLEFLVDFGIFLLRNGLIIASHICFVIADVPLSYQEIVPESNVVFENLGYPNSVESVLLSEIYEFVFNPSVNGSKFSGFPVLLSQKLLHASLLMDIELPNISQKYLDTAYSMLKQIPKNTPIAVKYNFCLVDLKARLATSNSGWLGKPKLSTVWGHLDKSFNKFIGGDDDLALDGAANEHKVFDSFTPSASRNASTVDLTSEMYNMYKVQSATSQLKRSHSELPTRYKNLNDNNTSAIGISGTMSAYTPKDTLTLFKNSNVPHSPPLSKVKSHNSPIRELISHSSSSPKSHMRKTSNESGLGFTPSRNVVKRSATQGSKNDAEGSPNLDIHHQIIMSSITDTPNAFSSATHIAPPPSISGSKKSFRKRSIAGDKSTASLDQLYSGLATPELRQKPKRIESFTTQFPKPKTISEPRSITSSRKSSVSSEISYMPPSLKYHKENTSSTDILPPSKIKEANNGSSPSLNYAPTMNSSLSHIEPPSLIPPPIFSASTDLKINDFAITEENTSNDLSTLKETEDIISTKAQNDVTTIISPIASNNVATLAENNTAERNDVKHDAELYVNGNPKKQEIIMRGQDIEENTAAVKEEKDMGACDTLPVGESTSTSIVGDESGLEEILQSKEVNIPENLSEKPEIDSKTVSTPVYSNTFVNNNKNPSKNPVQVTTSKNDLNPYAPSVKSRRSVSQRTNKYTNPNSVLTEKDTTGSTSRTTKNLETEILSGEVNMFEMEGYRMATPVYTTGAVDTDSEHIHEEKLNEDEVSKENDSKNGNNALNSQSSISENNANNASRFSPAVKSTGGSPHKNFTTFSDPVIRAVKNPSFKPFTPKLPVDEYYDDIVEDESDDDDDDGDELEKQREIMRKEKEKEEKEREEKERERMKKQAKEEKALSGKKQEGKMSGANHKNGDSDAGASWFGWLKKDPNAKKSVKAKLGHKNTFYYDEKLKRWVDKNASEEEKAKLTEPALPPPPPIIKKKSTVPPSKPRIGSVEGGPTQRTHGMVAPRNPLTGELLTVNNPKRDSSEETNTKLPVASPRLSPLSSTTSLSSKTANGLDDLISLNAGRRSASSTSRKGRRTGRGYVNVMDNIN
ncbi:uncharacterized protein SCODWIG_02666 [Saccharomycodes ludwigii]|uniref:Protein transport protein sec16 n=1 Tax=Saccharomycodes ludwigii TaxID=36035 RepID=A0A376B8B5_9ASCO|nr:uncharacterized protein SCODWIG_02666 [Saccharomycodes ludwigii]